MALIVQKYGGTSVGDIEKIKNVARRVIETKRKGNQVAVVVSAMAGETDRLIGLAHSISDMPDEREMDVLMSSGERVSIALLAIAINSMGEKAISFTGRQVGMVTDSVHMKARIERINAERIKAALNKGYIAVVAGFQGITPEGDVTTLGRGGSDTSAVAIAAAIKADVCEIYTDVDGVYTADPRIVPSAKRLGKISHEEMLELASLGAKVLQIRSVEFAMKYNVPLYVKSSFKEGGGTLVTMEDETMEQVLVTGVALAKDDAKISIRHVPDKPGIAASIFKPLAEASIVVDMIIQNVSKEGFTDITFTVPKTDAKKAMEIVNEAAKSIEAEEVLTDENIAKVSIVGAGMRNHSGVASKMFQALSAEGINIQMISTSEIKISCIIDSKYGELAVRTLHDAFELEKVER
ncbi:MAG: aspartate kinase [Candidatus Schekmanbacteria bacterium]|nr:MAG: aspartate kinase [Candidatus Schekmanbacteria bacterium]